MSSGTGALDHADLHGFVDGHIDGERRAATLRRLAASPADRARVEAWQGQNDLLRSSFAGIEREPLPAMLDLSAKSRLQCIPANDAPLVEPPTSPGATSTRRGRIVAAVATIIIIAAGLAGSWVLQDASLTDRVASEPTHEDTVEAAMPDSNIAETANRLDNLPTTEIPDLRSAGFAFTGAETTTNPPAIVFRYQNGSDRVSVRVVRGTASTGSSAPTPQAKGGYKWQSMDKSFSLSGTVSQARLRGIASELRKTGSSR